MDQKKQSRFLCSVIVPVFNEEDNIHPLVSRIDKALSTIDGCSYEIIFAMDPCTDQTELRILEERKSNSNIKLLRFSRRFGQPASTIGGLQKSQGDICVVIDADLQDPPEIIPELIDRWRENGSEVVYAQRKNRKGETIPKRVISYIAYYVINKIAHVYLPRNTGDFRLMTRRVVDHVLRLKESHGFLRGMVALVGFKQEAVLYDRDVRFTGRGNYNRWTGSFLIGFNGVFGFSRFPLTLISILGFLTVSCSVFMGIACSILMILGVTVGVDNVALLITIIFFSGVQMLCAGILGGYIGRIYDEVRERPMYIIESSYGFSDDIEK